MDDEFDDDSLDFIPDNTLQQLEQRAFSSTQKQKQSTPNVRPQPYKPRIQTYGGSGLSRNHVGIKSAWKPPQPCQQPRPSTVQDAPPASAPEPPSSDYGLDEEEVIDLDERSTTIPPAASGVPTRPRTANATPAPVSARHSRRGSRALLDPETEAAFAAADAELGAHHPGQWQSAPHLQPKGPENSAEYEALQARIAALEAEQTRLKQSEQQAREAALAKQGEISIVRSNQDKAVQEYERRIAVMQKLHTDEQTKWKGELEAGKKERERMNTDNRFLQHDLAQEVERGKRMPGAGKAKPLVNGAGTPRRSKKSTQGLGDGFDDDEVRMVSPSRSKEKEKSREQTPRAGSKRKRPVNDSPAPALAFSQPARAVNGDHAVSRTTSFQSQAAPAPAPQDQRFEFMQRLLLHTQPESQERTVEALAKHRFPSDTHRSLYTLLMDSLTGSVVSNQSDYLPLLTARALIELWTRCLMEKHYKPIALLLDLLRFVLDLEPASTVSQLIEEAVLPCMHCIEKVATIAFRVSTKPSYSASVEYQADSAIAEDIGIDEMLHFLHHLAGVASLSSERIDVFWRYIDLPPLLSMLNKALSTSQITTALQILATSTLQTTFGPVCEGEQATEKQAKSEKDIIDRLTIMLFDIPRAPADEPAYDQAEIAGLRVEVLQVLRRLCATDHGVTLLAGHRSFIGRLIRFLDKQANALYSVQPTYGLEALTLSDPSSPLDPSLSPHTLLTTSISLSTRILYHLLRHSDNNPNFNFLAKLQAVKGGYHKFLAALTRLAFSEQLVFEHGIEDEVVEAAHAVLDSVLSPEEGEAILKAVETPRGTRGSGLRTGDTTERDSSTDEEGEEGEGDGAMEEEPG